MVCVGTLCDTRKLVRLSCDVSLSAAGVCSTSNPPLGGDIACAFPDFMSVEKKGLSATGAANLWWTVRY